MFEKIGLDANKIGLLLSLSLSLSLSLYLSIYLSLSLSLSLSKQEDQQFLLYVLVEHNVPDEVCVDDLDCVVCRLWRL